MDVLEVLETLAGPAIVVLLATLLKVGSDLATKYLEELGSKSEDSRTQDYIQLAQRTVQSVARATNQTYVNSLKEDGVFDKNSQKKAFDQTKVQVLNILTRDVKDALELVYTDMDSWLDNEIESQVDQLKLEDPK